MFKFTNISLVVLCHGILINDAHYCYMRLSILSKPFWCSRIIKVHNCKCRVEQYVLNKLRLTLIKQQDNFLNSSWHLHTHDNDNDNDISVFGHKKTVYFQHSRYKDKDKDTLFQVNITHSYKIHVNTMMVYI